MMYLILLTVLLPLVLGVYLYFGKIENRNLKNVIIASIVGVGMAFVLMWFGARKLKQIFTNAVTKGKIKF